MSYFSFIACSRPLEPICYGEAPKAVFASYADYMKSSYYRCRRIWPQKLNPLEMQGSVEVYETGRSWRNFFIAQPFPAPEDWDEETKFIAEQFSLPYLYNTDYNLDFMCKYMQPEDVIEHLSIFLGHGAPLEKPLSDTIDLQDYVDGKLTWLDIDHRSCTPPHNRLLRFIPPRTPQLQLPIAPRKSADCICTICEDDEEEHWNKFALHLLGLL